MTHKFEEYPELSEMMQEYACFGSFSDWQKFTDALNNALIKAENLPIHNVVGQSEQYCDWCSSTEEVEVKICKKCRQGMDDHR
tara:strand:+ start:99 stop:347 length:249 start_codon:yes stop_codon:yes gene_type:complete